MVVGVPKEIQDNETRVGIVPAGVYQLREDGHQVLVEKNAGVGSGFSDREYAAAGATTVESAAELYRRSGLIVKVKEPVEQEHLLLQNEQIVFSYLHLAPLPDLTEILTSKRVTGVAYETIPDRNGNLPLLTPMSEVAGRMSTIVGAYYLQRPYGGRGVLLGAIPGVRAGLVVIVGAGTVGFNALKMAVGLRAQVSIMDVDSEKLRHIDDLFSGQVETLYSTPYALTEAAKRADLLIGSVLIPGASTPKLVTREMVASMKPGSVIVDVAVDQGGCCTTTRPTTHSNPIYSVDGVQHYCVTNMPAAMPRTSTLGLTNATLPYARDIAAYGLKGAIKHRPLLKQGVNTYRGEITHEAVAVSQGRPFRSLDELL